MPYAPAGNLTTTASLTHQVAIFYKKKGQDILKKRMRFMGISEPDVLPKRSGQTVQFYRYTLPIANTTPSSEGVVGTSLQLTTTTFSATVSQYSDFYTLSTMLVDTIIDPIIENTVDMASYRAALSVDVIVRTEYDANTAALLNTLGGALSAADFRRVSALLEGADIHDGPRGRPNFESIAHPYVLYDLMSDNSAGGWIDANRYAKPEELINPGEVGMIASVRIVSSTNVNTSGTAPNVLYSTYIAGKGAVGVVELAGNGPSDVSDPDRQAFKTNVIYGKPQMADPEGNIGAAVSYRFVMVAKTLDTVNLRFRIVQADASLV